MVWIADINDLQYYNQPVGADCYCETILKPSDMMLQGYLDFNGNGTYSIDIDVLSPDGTILIGNVTDAFTIYFGKSPFNNRDFFNAKLNGFPTEMCANPCFILKVTVTGNGNTYFLYYTERYCTPNCCMTVNGVVGGQDGISSPIYVQPDGNVTPFPPQVGFIQPFPPFDDPEPPIFEDPPPPPADTDGECGKVYMQLITWSDCYNAFSGRFYQTGTTYDGTPVYYKNVTNLTGRLVMQPGEFAREYSINCRLQRVQMQRSYLFEAFVLFPKWKMSELTDGFTDQYIMFDGVRYEMLEGPAFEQVQLPNECEWVYRMKCVFVECNIRQVHGCGDSCDSTLKGLIMPYALQENGAYYTENRQLIGTTCEDLANYYQSQQGVVSVTILDPDDYDCDFACALSIETLRNAYVPTSIYVNTPAPANRVFISTQLELDELCATITPVCAKPVIGTLEVEQPVCASPEIGTIELFTCTVVPADIFGFGTWAQEVSGNDAGVSCGTVVININVSSTSYPYAGGDDPFPVIPADVISLIASAARPATAKGLTNEDNSSIPVGASVLIDTSGYITYAGNPTASDGTGSTITLTNITYII